MAFTILSQMEATRQEKESILKRKSNNTSVLAAGTVLLVTAVLVGALVIFAELLPEAPANTSTTDNSFSTTMSCCAGLFGFAAVLSLLTGGLMTLNTKRKIRQAEQEYQEFRSKVITIFEGK